jgi:DNA-nicking Smr family endonuclease
LPPRPEPAVTRPSPDDTDLFASAMSDVVPLSRADTRVDGPAPAEGHARPVSEEAEALAALSDIVTGVAHFDITDTREYVEGTVVGLDPRVVRRLRRGDYSWQGHLDLHGLTVAEAREVVERFIVESFRAGRRCVLLIHGRGLNSKDQTPVLKERLKSWLAHGRIGKVVLAFATARPCDGGAGALYVLLRRDRRARPISVTEGAKR